MKVAMVGAGSMAREHLRAFRDAGWELAGIFSRTPARAQALAQEMGIAKVCESISQLYHSTCADLVIVAVPELAANSVATACFEHPWKVLMEKPAGYNLADAAAIARAAKVLGRQVFVALNRRFLSSTRSALDGLSACKGNRFIQVFDQQSLEAARAIGHPPQVVENWMYANSIHLVDYLRALGRGRVTRVTRISNWNPGKPSTVIAGVEFESGDTGLYQAIWSGPGPWAIAVTTSERRWEMRPLESLSQQNANERKLIQLEISDWDRVFKPGFRLQAEHAGFAVRNQAHDLPTLEDALETMHLISKIYDTDA